MLFHTWQYWGFFALVLAAFYSVPFRVGKLVLLIASYLFYMAWDWRFAGLILGSTVLDYGLGLALSAGSPQRKRILLVVSVVANLGVLAFFKYHDFFAANVAAALGLPQGSLALKLVLPVGISFYTFKSMSYTIDVCRGHL
jgi:alginate O-acetyltransferase complex protein AlgI